MSGKRVAEMPRGRAYTKGQKEFIVTLRQSYSQKRACRISPDGPCDRAVNPQSQTSLSHIAPIRNRDSLSNT